MAAAARPRSKHSIRRKLLLGFGVALLMLTILAFSAYRSTRGFIETAELATQTQKVIAVQNALLRHVKEAESGTRGFLVGGDERYLTTQEEAQQKIAEDFETLKVLLSDNPQQESRLHYLKQIVMQKIDILEKLVATRRSFGDVPAAQMFAKGEEEALMVKIRSVLADFENEEKKLLVERSKKTRTIGQLTVAITVIGTVSTALIVTMAGFFVLRDVAARRRAEEALAREHHLLKTIIDTMPDHVYVKDTKGKYVLSNNTHREYLRGLNPEPLEDKTVHDFFPRLLAVQYEASDRAALETGKPIINREEPAMGTGGKFSWLSTTKMPLRDTAGKIIGLVCASSDISERKAAEERLLLFADQLERSNRELQNFASVASHDLQEPLRKIQAFGDRLQSKCGEALGELGRDYLSRMQNAAQRMQTLIQDLLTLSRITSRAQPFVPVDLSETVWDVISDLEVRIETTGAKIEVGYLPTIDGDPLQMRQLFQNLISNALKFQKEGVTPLVMVSGKTVEMDDSQLLAASPGDKVFQLMVKDNGIGFEEKYAEQIFTVFQRLHGRDEYEGTGIGLAVCRKITDRHGGEIIAKSTPGEGTTFIVTLPIKQRTTERT